MDIRDSIACIAPPVEYLNGTANWMKDNFPSIELEFGNGVRICMSPVTYFFLSNKQANSYCIGIFGDSKTVIGAISMAGFTVAFDYDSNRVGIARSDCDSLRTNGGAKEGDKEFLCCGMNCRGNYNGNKNGNNNSSNSNNGTSIPTMDDGDGFEEDKLPASFWDTEKMKTVSGYFFFLGIIFAGFCSCACWLYWPRKRNDFGMIEKVEPGNEEEQREGISLNNLNGDANEDEAVNGDRENQKSKQVQPV